MPIERKNYNLRALNASLRSELPTMKAEAERLIAEAIAAHETLTAAADSLGLTYQALNRLRKAPPEKKKPKAKRKG